MLLAHNNDAVMPHKATKIEFNELGQVVLPAGVVLAPSEDTLLARAYLLQSQEPRRDSEMLKTSIATPDELKAFVGGRSDVMTGDILDAKVAQASAAQLRKPVAVAGDQASKDSGKLVTATKKTSAAVNNLRQESTAASRLADITAKSLLAAQLAATTDSSEAVRLAVDAADTEARVAAADAAAAADALKEAVEDLKAASASRTPATPAPSDRPSRPGYVDTMVTSLAKRVAYGKPEAQPGIEALERLVASGFFTGVVNPGSAGPFVVEGAEINDLRTFLSAKPPKQGARH